MNLKIASMKEDIQIAQEARIAVGEAVLVIVGLASGVVDLLFPQK